jgi:hypothetical protein
MDARVCVPHSPHAVPRGLTLRCTRLAPARFAVCRRQVSANGRLLHHDRFSPGYLRSVWVRIFTARAISEARHCMWVSQCISAKCTSASACKWHLWLVHLGWHSDVTRIGILSTSACFPRRRVLSELVAVFGACAWVAGSFGTGAN